MINLGFLGRAEGFALIGIVLFSGLCGLLALHFLSGGEFVSAFQLLVVSYFGGGALSAFRDMKKPAP